MVTSFSYCVDRSWLLDWGLGWWFAEARAVCLWRDWGRISLTLCVPLTNGDPLPSKS